MLSRSVRDAFKSVFRNFSLSLASISCTTITLLIVAVAILLSLNVQNFSKLIEKDVTMIAYVNEAATKEDTDKLLKEIEALNNVASVTFETKVDAKNAMMNTSETFKSLLSEWDEKESPLKDNFRIKVKNLEEIKQTAKDVQQLSKIDIVRYGEGMIDKLISSFKAVVNFAYIFVIALLVVTVFLIINTIKLTIFSRKREISIMRLVGASNISIKMPFVIEGMFLGLIGSIIPLLTIIFGYTSLYQYFGGYIYSRLITLIPPEPFTYLVSLTIMGIGIVIGMIGSARAVS
ncbi:MAG: permease-like cell division protein FtsX, partial [Bacilli bacterium]